MKYLLLLMFFSLYGCSVTPIDELAEMPVLQIRSEINVEDIDRIILEKYTKMWLSKEKFFEGRFYNNNYHNYTEGNSSLYINMPCYGSRLDCIDNKDVKLSANVRFIIKENVVYIDFFNIKKTKFDEQNQANERIRTINEQEIVKNLINNLISDYENFIKNEFN